MNRIAVIGSGGSGKTTFSLKLGKKTGLPVHHLDTIFWTAGWVEEDPERFLEKQRQWIQQDQWIIDGNMHNSLPLRLERCDTVVFLDYSTWHNLFGIIKRLTKDFGKNRTDMAEGCHESFDWSFFLYVAAWQRKTRPQIMTLLNEGGHANKVHIFKNPKQTQEWLKTL